MQRFSSIFSQLLQLFPRLGVQSEVRLNPRRQEGGASEPGPGGGLDRLRAGQISHDRIDEHG